MSINKFFELKLENVTLLQSMQLCLNPVEVDDLNVLLYEYAESCLANRANAELNAIIYAVKMQFKRFDKPC